MDRKTRRMRSEHLLLLLKIEQPLGPCERFRQAIRMDAVIDDVTEANMAAGFNQLVGDDIFTLLVTVVPFGEIDDRNG